MATANRDHLVDVGTDFSRVYQCVDQSGALLNFAGCSATLMVRVSASDASPLISISTTPSASGSITLDATGTTGYVTIAIARAAVLTAAVAAPVVTYELEVTWTDGTVSSLLKGYMTFSPQVVH